MKAEHRAAWRTWKRLRKQLSRAKKEGSLQKARHLVDKVYAAVKELQIQEARRTPDAFIEYAFQDKNGIPLRQSPMHKRWQSIIYHKDIFPDGLKRSLIIAPRDHGKTSQIPVGRVLWEIGTNPNLRIKIVCQSDSKAMERLFEIIDNMERNPRVSEVFPGLKPAARGDWTKHKIVVNRTIFSKDASIEALGVLSTATGGRADLLVADDIVDRRNAIQFPQLRETIKHSWKSDWTNLLEPDGRLVYICTLWHKADNSHELMDNPAYGVLLYAINDDLEAMNCSFTGPRIEGERKREEWEGALMDMWGKENLAARLEEIGTTEFNRGFRNIALSGEIAVVRDEWVTYYNPAKIPLELVIYQGYDLAISKKTHADYFSCVTIGVDLETWTIYVLDAWHSRLSFIQQGEAIINEYFIHKPESQIIETTAYQESLPQYLDSLAGTPLDETTEVHWVKTESENTTTLEFLEEEVKSGRIPLLPIERVKPRFDKMSRLKRVTPYMERGKILFSPKMKPQDNLNLRERGDLVSELLNFPLGRHDDILDAFVHVVSYAVRVQVEATGQDEKEIECSVRVYGV